MHQTMEIYRGTDPETFKIYSGEDIMTLSLLCPRRRRGHRRRGACGRP